MTLDRKYVDYIYAMLIVAYRKNMEKRSLDMGTYTVKMLVVDL